MFKGKLKNWVIEAVVFPLLFIFGLILAYNINFVNRKATQEIYSDKAHYYVYLPATFIYGWDVNKFPKNIEKECEGFLLDKMNHKVVIKTTCGVALLCTPFFLVTNWIAETWNLQPDGFSLFYQEMTIVPAIFYLVLGLFFLFRFLLNYVNKWTSYLTILLIFTGTNLYFYSIDDGLMSHVYSFFLFSAYLFLLRKFLYQEKRSLGLFAAISLVLSLAILIRPTNIVLFLLMLFLDADSVRTIMQRFRIFLRPFNILIFIIIAFLVFLPQFIYWKYLSGHFIYNSYPGEGFSLYAHPQVLSILFAPLNGLILYTPFVLFFIAGIIIMIRKKKPNGILTGVLFLLITYIFSAWHCWFFGGSFGSRPYVEFYAMFALPFAYFLLFVKKQKNLFTRSLLILLVICSVWYNLRLTYHQFWNTSSTWAWDDFLDHLDGAGLYHENRTTYTFVQDFENPSLGEFNLTLQGVHSPTVAYVVDKNNEFSELFKRPMHTILNDRVREIHASIWIQPGKTLRTGALFSCTVGDWQHNLFIYQSVKIDDFLKTPETWTKIEQVVEIPEWVDKTNIVSFYIWNVEKKCSFTADDLTLKFE
jgi:hypothetical protein